MAEHNELGKQGESAAEKYLLSKGYVISAVNWRFGNDEIDIIAEDKDNIIFVEVKTRSTLWYGSPEIFVTRQKQRFIIRAANNFIIKNNINKEARFDIISVLISPESSEIEHIENAFYPML